jgi:hypothetical protein
MLYLIRVLFAEREPHPWNSLDGVLTVEMRTPDIVHPGEKATAEQMQEMLSLRQRLGRIPSPTSVVLLTMPPKTPREYVYVACDGVGLVHAALGVEETTPDDFVHLQWTALRHREWRQVGGLFLRVEQVREPASTWWASLKGLTRWQRFLNWVLWRRCRNCLYFDQRGAHEWRTKVTHAFAGVSNGPNSPLAEAMWDDVTKITAAQHRAPDFRAGEFGYCPKRDCGLSGRLLACGEYKRT